MHLAAAQRSLRGISLLLANGASVTAKDHGGRTPLHVACANRDNESRSGGDSDSALMRCVELLLSSGALQDARDAKGQTALHLSALAGNLIAARALLAAGATVVADDAGNSPLHLAAAEGHSDIIQLLVVGNREEPPRKPSASGIAEVDTGGQCRPPASGGELYSVGDVDVSAHHTGPGIVVSTGWHQSASSTAAKGQAFFGDDDVTAPIAMTEQARDNHQVISEGPAEEKNSSREVHARCADPEVLSLKDELPASVDDGRTWGGPSSLNSVLSNQSDNLGQWVIRDSVRPGWQGQSNSHNGMVEDTIRKAGRISEDGIHGRRGHHAVEAGHRRRRARGSMPSRRRYEGGRDGRALCWPEALPSNQYEQVTG